MSGAEGDRRKHFVTLTGTTVFDPASGLERYSSLSAAPLPYSPDEFEGIEQTVEVTFTGIRRPEPPTVIERLRRENPDRNICDVAVEKLDDPVEMAQFLIQYAWELGKTSEKPEIKANPFDTAVQLIHHMAFRHGGKIARRWFELIGTGTVRNVPDHSLDWLIPTRRKGGE